MAGGAATSRAEAERRRAAEIAGELIEVLADSGPLTHNELVVAAGRSYALVEHGLEELVIARLVEVDSSDERSHAARYRLRGERRPFMVAYLEAATLEVRLIDLSGIVIDKATMRARRDVEWSAWVTDALCRLASDLLERTPHARLARAAVAVVGRVPAPGSGLLGNWAPSVVESASEAGVTSARLATEVANRLDVPVDLLHPAHAKAIAVCHRAPSSPMDIVLVDHGDELSGAVVVDGRLRVGAGGRAAAVGLLPGTRGVSLEHSARFHAPVDADPWFVVADAAAGDTRAAAAVDDGISAVAEAAVMLAAAYDPELLVITGSMAVYPDSIRDRLRSRIEAALPQAVSVGTAVEIVPISRELTFEGIGIHVRSAAGLTLAR